MDIIIKYLLDNSLLTPDYDKDLEFIKLLCESFSLGNHVNKVTFDNALDGLSDLDKVNAVSNWYVLLTCVPGITSSRTRVSMITRLEEWPCTRKYLSKSGIIHKVNEFLNLGVDEDNPNLRW